MAYGCGCDVAWLPSVRLLLPYVTVYYAQWYLNLHIAMHTLTAG